MVPFRSKLNAMERNLDSIPFHDYHLGTQLYTFCILLDLSSLF